MSFNSSKRVIGFVIIALMGGGPLLALTSKKKPADTAAVVKAPRLSAKSRARNAGMHKQSKQRSRAYRKNVKRKKSSKNTFLTHKKSHKKVASSKSKQLANKKKLSSKRMHNKAQVRKVQTTRKSTRVATRAHHKQALPLTEQPQETH